MRRAVAPGLIQGALRGLLAGVFTAAIVAGFAFALFDAETGTAVALAIPILAAVMGAGDGLEARVPGNAGRAARIYAPLAGGALAATVMATAHELVFNRARVGVPTGEIMLAALTGFGAGIPLSIGMLVAGPHARSASTKARFRRALLAAGTVVLLPTTWALLLPERWVVLLAASLVVAVALVYALGHLIARPLGRSVGEWLEPNESWTLRTEARDEYAKLARDAARLRKIAEAAENDGARRAALERGSEAARSAFDVAERARLELVREESLRQFRYFLRALGREEEAKRVGREALV